MRAATRRQSRGPGPRTGHGKSETAGPAPSKRKSLKRFEGAAYLGPALVVMAVIIAYPIFRTIWLSFTDADLGALITGEMQFVGIDNYMEIWENRIFRRALVNTVVLGFSTVAATMVLGLGVALLLNERFKGRAVLAVLVLLPWAVPRIAAAFVWRWMYNDQYGFINWLLAAVGFGGFEGYAWLASRHSALFAIASVIVWQAYPLVAVVLLAGLQSISDEVIEASQVDGAHYLRRLWHILLPPLRPQILVLVVISTIWNFRVFDQVYVMTRGGPSRSTEVLSLSAWRQAFTQLDFGISSALAVVVFVLLLVVSLIYVRLIREDL